MSNEKVVLITGSTRGIGLGIAEAFAKKGYHIVLNARSTIEESLLNRLKDTYQVKVEGVCGDVSQMTDCLIIKQFVEEKFGRLDVLVNNAGITKDNLFLRMSEEDFRMCIDVNLMGTFNMTKVFLKDFMKKRQGSIVNLASVSGVVGNVGQTNYAASKAGIIGFTKSLAKEVAPRKITVNAIAPGFIETDMTQSLLEEVKEKAKELIPLKRFGLVEEVAKGAVFLAENPYMTGQVLHIDGGMVMNG